MLLGRADDSVIQDEPWKKLVPYVDTCQHGARNSSGIGRGATERQVVLCKASALDFSGTYVMHWLHTPPCSEAEYFRRPVHVSCPQALIVSDVVYPGSVVPYCIDIVDHTIIVGW